MKKCFCALSAAAGLLTATPAFSLADPGAAGGVPAAEVQQPVKLNPTKRVFEIEVPVKSDGALLGNVGIKITPNDELFVDAKLLKKYLAKVIKPDILTAALAVPAPAVASCGRHHAGGQKGAGCRGFVAGPACVAAGGGRSGSGRFRAGAAQLSAA